MRNEMGEETSSSVGSFEKLLDFKRHCGYVAHKDRLLVAYDLAWDPLEIEDEKEIRVHTFTLNEALDPHFVLLFGEIWNFSLHLMSVLLLK